MTDLYCISKTMCRIFMDISMLRFWKAVYSSPCVFSPQLPLAMMTQKLIILDRRVTAWKSSTITKTFDQHIGWMLIFIIIESAGFCGTNPVRPRASRRNKVSRRNIRKTRSLNLTIPSLSTYCIVAILWEMKWMWNEAKSVGGNHWLRLSPSVAPSKRASLEQFGH